MITFLQKEKTENKFQVVEFLKFDPNDPGDWIILLLKIIITILIGNLIFNYWEYLLTSITGMLVVFYACSIIIKKNGN